MSKIWYDEFSIGYTKHLGLMGKGMCPDCNVKSCTARAAAAWWLVRVLAAHSC